MTATVAHHVQKRNGIDCHVKNSVQSQIFIILFINIIDSLIFIKCLLSLSQIIRVRNHRFAEQTCGPFDPWFWTDGELQISLQGVEAPILDTILLRNSRDVKIELHDNQKSLFLIIRRKNFICQGKYWYHVVFHSSKAAKGTTNRPINMREIF